MAMISTNPRLFRGLSASTLFNRLSRMNALRKQRALLKSLPAKRLADLGVSAKQAHQEANRPIWDVPSHWQR